MTAPAKLKTGDSVALLAPSGPCEPSRLEPSVLALEKFGLVPRVMESCHSRHGYFAGSDSLRARDIMDAFADKSIKGVFALRGGYGAQRLLPLLDYDLIAENPKIFCGYSDITVLHTVFNQRCGFITYHAPMAATELYMPELDSFTTSSFEGSIFENRTTPELSYSPINPIIDPPGGGRAGRVSSGRLTGGNLSMLVSTIGTAYEIDTGDKILFLEDIQEEPYKVDRMLLQLKQAGKFDKCRAILLGSFLPETSKSLSQAIKEILLPLGKPLGHNIPCGHCLPTATLALGAQTYMSAGIIKQV